MICRNPPPRAIELPRNRSPYSRSCVPVVEGYCRQPILAEENIEEYFPLPKVMVRNDTVFLLRVRGDSMINAGIMNGDYVIVRRQETAQSGEIVVAMLEDEATVKRFYKEKDHIRLEPENDLYEPIRSPFISVIGKVIGVFRTVN